MVTTGSVCHLPAVPLTALSHTSPLSDASCDKTPRVVEPRNSQESRKVMWLRVIDAEGSSMLRSFTYCITRGITITITLTLTLVRRGGALVLSEEWRSRLSETLMATFFWTAARKKRLFLTRVEPVSEVSLQVRERPGRYHSQAVCFLTPLASGVDGLMAPSVINHSCPAQIYSCEWRIEGEKKSGRYPSLQLNINVSRHSGTLHLRPQALPWTTPRVQPSRCWMVFRRVLGEPWWKLAGKVRVTSHLSFVSIWCMTIILGWLNSDQINVDVQRSGLAFIT